MDTKIGGWVFVYMNVASSVYMGMVCVRMEIVIMDSVFVDNVVTVDIFDSILVSMVRCVGIFFPVVADSG